MTKTARTSVLSPVEVASSAGAARSGWLKVGDGRWSGTVTTKEEVQLTVEELAVGWKVSDETGKSATRPELAVALEQMGVRR